jgi:hypothetical protein
MYKKWIVGCLLVMAGSIFLSTTSEAKSIRPPVGDLPVPPEEVRPIYDGDVSLGNPPRGADKPLEADGVEVSMNPIDRKKFEEAVKKWWEDERNLGSPKGQDVSMAGTPPDEWGGNSTRISL